MRRTVKECFEAVDVDERQAVINVHTIYDDAAAKADAVR